MHGQWNRSLDMCRNRYRSGRHICGVLWYIRTTQGRYGTNGSRSGGVPQVQTCVQVHGLSHWSNSPGRGGSKWSTRNTGRGLDWFTTNIGAGRRQIRNYPKYNLTWKIVSIIHHYVFDVFDSNTFRSDYAPFLILTHFYI
jgi:hypothetical protein